MATEIKVWQIENEKISLINTTMIEAGQTESKLEQWIENNPDILGEDIKIIGKQVETKSGKIDLLGLDSLGNIVIIELKRDKTSREALAQAIDYASDVASWDINKLDAICKNYKNQPLDAYINEKTPDSVNQTQRILLVGTCIEESLQRMIEWLSSRFGVSINAIILKYIKTKSGDELLARTMIVPEETEKERSQKQRKLLTIEDHYNRLNPPLGEYLKNLIEELNIEPTNLSASGFHLINRDKKIIVATYIKSKIEFQFVNAKKEEIENLLKEMNITSFNVKDKADIQSYNVSKPIPSIDYKEEYGSFEDIKKICKTWLKLQ